MTTAAVVAYYSQESKARISYAGHPPVLYRRANDKAWSYARPPGRKGLSDGLPMNIPLAVTEDTFYGQLTIPMAPGDRLFVYTDGIIDAPSPEGVCFGLERLTITVLKSAVLQALHQYAGKELTHDDVTMIVLEIC